jgi:hypothetical protein
MDVGDRLAGQAVAVVAVIVTFHEPDHIQAVLEPDRVNGAAMGDRSLLTQCKPMPNYLLESRIGELGQEIMKFQFAPKAPLAMHPTAPSSQSKVRQR